MNVKTTLCFLFIILLLTACNEKNAVISVSPSSPNISIDPTALAVTATTTFSFYNESATLTNGTTKTCRMLKDVIAPVTLSTYGGNLNKKQPATGYFTTFKNGTVWALQDPQGYEFLTVGINSVDKGGTIALPNALWDVSANTMGCWSDPAINTGAIKKMPYCLRWNMMFTFKNTNTRRTNLYNAGIIPVFDAEFPAYCETIAQGMTSTKTDPYLFGHFSDNELPVYDNDTYGLLLDRFLKIADKTDPNYLAANTWMQQRKGTATYTIADADRLAFHGYVMETYYKIARTAIKKYDPNHLYLGSRLHGGAKTKQPIFAAAGKYVDVISVNVYGWWTVATTDMDMWLTAANKPFFVTEFYAKAADSGLSNTTGDGFDVKTQADRARFYENFTLTLLEHKGCVGWHFFKYQDNTTNNCGMLDKNYVWWTNIYQSYRKIGRNVYPLRDYIVKK